MWTVPLALGAWEFQVAWLKTIRLLTAVPSWDAEGQMVRSQQVITASMLMHRDPHTKNGLYQNGPEDAGAARGSKVAIHTILILQRKPTFKNKSEAMAEIKGQKMVNITQFFHASGFRRRSEACSVQLKFPPLCVHSIYYYCKIWGIMYGAAVNAA